MTMSAKPSMVSPLPWITVAARGLQGRRVRQGHASRGSVARALEGAEERAKELPGGQATGTGGGLPGSREVRGEEGVGELSGDHRLRHHPALGGSGRRGWLGRRL